MKRLTFGSAIAASCAALLLSLSAGCRSQAPTFIPPPRVDSLEGYASLRYSGDAGSAKSRLSFQIVPPARGRVEVLDPLGRVALYFVLDGPRALLVVPREKVYCEAGSADVMERLVGFGMDARELSALLSGIWPEPVPADEGAGSWALERDGRGRVRAGRRDGAFFEVAEFFAGSPSPKRVDFGSERGSGRLTVLRLGYNRPLPNEAFESTPPAAHEPRSWEDVERLFKRED
jgi:hypothetical protein